MVNFIFNRIICRNDNCKLSGVFKHTKKDNQSYCDNENYIKSTTLGENKTRKNYEITSSTLVNPQEHLSFSTPIPLPSQRDFILH